MNTDWIEYKCKSGETLFIYNKVTGEHKWHSDISGSIEESTMHGEPIIYKELCSAATQTDDYGCDNGCTSMYINTGLCSSTNTSETLQKTEVGISSENASVVDEFDNTMEGVLSEDNFNDISGSEYTLKTDEIDEQDEVDNVQFHSESADTISGQSNVNESAEKIVERQLKEMGKTNSGNKKRPMDCPFCSKQILWKGELINHLRKHTGEKPFGCSICKKHFAQKSGLRTHMKIHSGDRAYQCSYCDKTFVQKIQMLRHVQTHKRQKHSDLSGLYNKSLPKANFTLHVESSEKVEPMEFCVFSKTHEDQRTKINQELLKNNTEKEKDFKCAYCNKQFSCKYYLSRHIRMHIGSQYKCCYCGKLCTNKRELIEHIRTHTGEKPFECSQCGKKFAQKSTLKSHEQTHTGEKPFHCVYCIRKYTKRSSLKKHLKKHFK